MSFLTAAAWTLILGVVFHLAMWITEAARPGAVGDLVSMTACNLLADSVLLFAILRVHEPETSVRQALGLRMPSVVVLVFSAIAGGAFTIPGLFVNKLFASRFPIGREETEIIERMYAAPTLSKKILIVITMVVLVPIFDELFFRGGLFGPLKKGRRLEAVILATAAYDTLLQTGGTRHVLTVMVVAIALAWIRATAASTIPSIAARVAFFGVQWIPDLLSRPLPSSRNAALVSGAVAAVALVVVGAVARRDPRTLDARLDDG